MTNLLRQRIKDAVERHGSLRAAACVLQVDSAYLWRLMNGLKDAPSDSLLRRLGVRRVVTYVQRAPTPPAAPEGDAAATQKGER